MGGAGVASEVVSLVVIKGKVGPLLLLLLLSPIGFMWTQELSRFSQPNDVHDCDSDRTDDGDSSEYSNADVEIVLRVICDDIFTSKPVSDFCFAWGLAWHIRRRWR
jgi:hypothetical protein